MSVDELVGELAGRLHLDVRTVARTNPQFERVADGHYRRLPPTPDPDWPADAHPHADTVKLLVLTCGGRELARAILMTRFPAADCADARWE